MVSWLSVVVPPMELSRPSLSGGKMVILRATTGREIQTFGLLRVRMSKVRNKESSNNPKYTSKREALRKENVWPQTMRIPCFNKRYRINSFTILFPAKNAPRRPAPGGPDCDCGRACLDTAKHCALYLLLRCLPSGSFCATQRLDCASKV